MSTETKETTEKGADRAEAYTLLFEIENVAAGGRKAQFDAVKKAVSEAGGKLTPSLFSRHAMEPNPADYAEELLAAAGAKDGGADKFIESVNNALNTYFQDRASIDAGLEKLVKAATSLGVSVGVVTSLSEEAAAQLLARLGLTDTAKVFQVKDLEKGYPRADSWLKASKQFGRPSRNCIVVATCMTACKSALSAGMRCIVVPDEFTGHQDFSGADIVLDTWDEMSAKEVLTTIVPAE
ncbi:MAG TPA: HAD hydrolase-like protein [Kiritimatiellia bacterium]|jgi:beta-phosphoglucomutase-like phosphatase (HAD superfamily)